MYESKFDCFQRECTYGLPNDIDPKLVLKGDSIDAKSSSNVEIQFYPNPVDHILYIESSNAIEEVCLITIQGEVVRKLVLSNETTIAWDLSYLNSGIYICRLCLSNGKVQYEKIIVQ